ncbi:uncharacterized protein CANTADRAFT_7704 [Suhomyces tanzawaensis NRRL Y-17324]|uniref:Uncharacterized protein n=1 Tax=Suhomyces tanzawaensis NRRL Y-17324 TaxID=984487 RepID=A0A1E4SCI0_9ASCO|nr:uncharacterized protein CANTADRAFT_7704 [Suhomyces tanzawaensis NRRL Y-17324]ODV77209.1 hypothetical protein CANTADRAFT_7704 [Suhomyces tanzawaensis NRRL Y-17324]
MVAKSKSSTPAIEGHPSLNLSVGNQDQITQLSKLQPILLLNQQDESDELKALRVDYKYLYVVNWLYNFRGYIKLQSETFDVDLFELELLHYFPATHAEDENGNPTHLLLDKIKLGLMSSVQNSKLTSLNNFEKLFRLWFGYETPLKGRDREEEIENGEDYGDEEDDPKFDSLSITEKFEILFILITYISSYAGFRNWVDKNNLTLNLRMDPILTERLSSEKNSQVDYILLFENNRLYKRIVKFNPLVIPKKRKVSPIDPNEYYEPSQFDIDPNVDFELIFKNIYEFDEVLQKYSKGKNNASKTLTSKLSRKAVVESILENEIRKRRIITNKRKELQLASLLATRKRSSRLEAKEKQRQEELRVQREQEEYELKVAAQKRFERRMKLKEQQGQVAPDYTSGLTRDERLKLRRSDAERTDSHSATPMKTPDNTPIETPAPTDNGQVGVTEVPVPTSAIPVQSETLVPTREILEQQAPVPASAIPEQQAPVPTSDIAQGQLSNGTGHVVGQAPLTFPGSAQEEPQSQAIPPPPSNTESESATYQNGQSNFHAHYN